jgi:hypothetical protein
LKSSNGEDLSVDVEWEADNKTGYADKFKVYYAFENVVYEMFEGCDYPERKEMIHTATESNINLKKLEPFSKYSVKVSALNKLGESDQSDSHIFHTKQAPATPPRDVSISYISNTNDNSKIQATISWKPPCKLNGHLQFYHLTLKGNRNGLEDVSENSATVSNPYQNYTFNDLRRGFNYDVSIKAQNSDFHGEAKKFTFKAPSGSEF